MGWVRDIGQDNDVGLAAYLFGPTTAATYATYLDPEAVFSTARGLEYRLKGITEIPYTAATDEATAKLGTTGRIMLDFGAPTAARPAYTVDAVTKKVTWVAGGWGKSDNPKNNGSETPVTVYYKTPLVIDAPAFGSITQKVQRATNPVIWKNIRTFVDKTTGEAL
jgi:hypothetical protein